MVKNKRFLVFFILLLIISGCSSPKNTQVKDQLGELDTMLTQAVKIMQSLQNKKGKEYISGHDKYYDLLLKRTNTAMQYLEKAEPAKLALEDLKKLAQIAEIAQDEQKIVDVLKSIFKRFPESKTDKRLLQVYFPNAYLLEPDEVEKYVDITLFTPNEQLQCYYALALGFAEWGNPGQAEMYVEKGNALLKQLISERIQRNTIPVMRIAGLRSFIAWKLGHADEAFRIINEAKEANPDDYSIKQLTLFENRLKILGQMAKSLEYQFWVGAEQPVDLAALKGKVILLNFFTWSCETCNTYLPSLFALQEQFKSADFLMVGATQYIGSYENNLNISELREYEYLKDHYYKQRKLKWPVCIIRNDSMDGYGVNSYPAYVLIDKQGVVSDGYFISNYAYLKKKIELLLKK